MNILAFESSCDETAAAVVQDGRVIRSNVIASSVEVHALYGGVVPELASRAHVEAIVPVADRTLSGAGLTLNEVDAVAVTYAPGLIGAVLVGVNFAKSAALAAGKPLIPVHHSGGTSPPITSPTRTWSLPSSACASPAAPPPSSM